MSTCANCGAQRKRCTSSCFFGKVDEAEELAWARSVLADHYTPDGCRIWWRSFNHKTGGVPAEQWESYAGRDAVLRELERIDGGGEQ